MTQPDPVLLSILDKAIAHYDYFVNINKIPFYYYHLQNNHMHNGLCSYFNNLFLPVDYKHQLIKLIDKYFPFYKVPFYFMMPSISLDINMIKTECLSPRLQLLKHIKQDYINQTITNPIKP